MKTFMFLGLMLAVGMLVGCASHKHAMLCSGCGELKGGEVCCKAEGRETCGSCGMFKGSVGCCKVPEGFKGDLKICSCGEIKGTDACCNSEGRTACGKCGMLKGSVACCKVKKE